MLSKILILTSTLFISTPLLAGQTDNFLTRKDSYVTHRKDNFKHFNKEARKNGPIHETVEELPSEIRGHLTSSKSGEFDKKNRSAVFSLMDHATNGHFSHNFSLKELSGGFVSGKIYKVTNDDTGQSYFIKYLRQRKFLVPQGRILGEQANLEAIKENPRLDNYRWMGTLRSWGDLSTSGFEGSNEHFISQNTFDKRVTLKIVVPTHVYSYSFKGKDKIFMILPGAKGRSLASFMEESLTPAPTSKAKYVAPYAIDKVSNAFARVGTAMGLLHVSDNTYKGQGNPQVFDKEFFSNLGVYSHGDFHSHNVFLHKNTVSLIDAETVANSFGSDGKPNSPIYYDFFYLMLMTEKHFPGAMKAMDWKPFKDLFKAYIQCYPQQMQEGISSYLYYHLENIKQFNFTDLFENFTWKKNYSKSTVLGAQNIANFLVKETVEELRRKANEQFQVKKPDLHEKTEDNLASQIRESTSGPRQVGNRIAGLLQKHNQFIEQAQPKALFTKF